MHESTAGRLLQIWEDTREAHPIEQALSLLQLAWPQRERAQWARVPIGARDARLLDLHEAWFGGGFQTIADCSACGTRLEADFPAGAIRVEPMADGADAVHTVQHGGQRIEFRLPNSEDLLEIAALDDADAALQALLRRCIAGAGGADGVDGTDGGAAATSSQPLSEMLCGLIDVEMARLDPGADLRLRLRCPACGHEQGAAFDIAAYLRDELDDWAQRLLADVHVLARAYGWSEREVLGLSPLRRQHYIEMVLA